MNVAARILVASDVVADATVVARLLHDEFGDASLSNDPGRAVDDFDACRPDVLVLAFDSLEKAQRWYLGLYRQSGTIHGVPHRTVLLCQKDELRPAYELCRRGTFDDYVLFWPMAHDGLRLPMAVHQSLRRGNSAREEPTASELAVQARRLAALEARLDEHAARGVERIDAAGLTLRRTRRDIGEALSDVAQRLRKGGSAGGRSADRFERELARLDSGEIAAQLDAVAAQIEPVRDSMTSLRQELAPRAQALQALGKLADAVRPLVLIVDDDDYQHKLLRSALRDLNCDFAAARSGAEALAALRHCRPDLILMDVGLPDMDGVEATRRIKAIERFAQVPVMMITGRGEKEVVVRSALAGAIRFFVKPVEKDRLLAKVRTLLGGDAAPAR